MNNKVPQQRKPINKQKTAPADADEVINDVSEKESFVPYTVAVRASILNVRREPSITGKITAQLRKDQILTVSEEKDGWGKLMSGAGWISLEYTQRRDQDE